MNGETCTSAGAPKPFESRLNCVDLFSGAGGFTLAAQQAGLRVRLAVENDVHAVATYRQNFCKGSNAPHLLQEDLRTIIPADAYSAAFDSVPCDLMLGGPPCQGFSTHRIKGAGVDDARNDLIHVYFDFVRAFAPSAFLMENVPGMLWGRHSAALDRFYVEGAEAGYDVLEPIVVDARDYGVPQRRKRVFILGIKSGVEKLNLCWPPPPSHGSEVARRSDRLVRPWVDCTHAFRAAEPDDENDRHMTHCEDLVEAFRQTPANGGSRKDSGRTLPCHEVHDGHKDVYGRIDARLPAPTMTTACINPSKGRFVHPIENHGITVRQAARIQTFPDSFIFKGGLMAAGKQVGNAVPIALGAALIGHLVPLLRQARNPALNGGT